VSALAFCLAAKFLTSCVIFIEQNLGPHIEQKWAVLAPSAGTSVILLGGVGVQGQSGTGRAGGFQAGA
jgi:hypothetical protein